MPVRGRVITVRPRSDGTFAVTLFLRERQLGWMLAPVAPRMGALLEIEGAEEKVYEQRGATVKVLGGGDVRVVDEPWARRYVPRPWLVAATKASRVRLYPHQIEGAGWLAQRLRGGHGGILADDQGLGKTVQAGVALFVARTFPAIVVCPSSVKRAWERELHDMLDADLRISVLDGYEGAIPPSHVIIANYDLLRAREKQLRALGARAIVFDEGQILKEPAPSPSHRAAVATRLAHRIGRAMILSGTPLPNKLPELWRLLHVVDRKEWPDFDDFQQRYCVEPEEDEVDVGRHVITDYGRVHRLDELHARMAPYMLRRLKSHVLSHLPPKERRTVTVELGERERALYDRCEKDVVAWLRGVGQSARADSAARGQALVKLQMLRRIAAMAKLRSAVPRYLERWFATHGRGLVIFGYHTPVLKGVKRICMEMGLRIAAIHRKDSDRKRQANVDAFCAHQADVFLAPIRAGGVGLNLQHGGHHVLFLERMWVVGAMAQAEDRVHRLGQKETVQITYLDAARTVDEHIARVLRQKQKIIDVVVDDRELEDEELERQALDDVLESMNGPQADDDDGDPQSDAGGPVGAPGGAAERPHRDPAAQGDVLRERSAGVPAGP
jgi:SWI/SNF-related matrix-associated actin-dependent regulator 1 of chromatin subfamily A